ncbi:MAG: hypothetical protein MK135_15385 [Polyangiaceae bacterium]|nr:hypothetical protein [Polyangiaceae bacterium]
MLSRRVFGQQKKGGAALLVLSSSFFWGCYAAPQIPFVSGRSLLDRNLEETNCSRAIRGEARMSFAGDGRRLSGQLLYLAEAPEQLRLDILSPFGVTVSTLTSDGREFSLYQLESRSYLTGEANQCNLQKFTQVPIPPRALVEILRGRPPVLVAEGQAPTFEYIQPVLGRGYYQWVIWGANQTREELHFTVEFPQKEPALQVPRLKFLSVEQAGQILYEVHFRGYAKAEMAQATARSDDFSLMGGAVSGPACSAKLPSEVELSVPSTGYRLMLSNVEVEHNPVLASDVFQQAIPSGVVVQRSKCSGE